MSTLATAPHSIPGTSGHASRRRALRLLAGAPLLGALGACGFALRGSFRLPFQRLRLSPATDSGVTALLRADLQAAGVEVLTGAPPPPDANGLSTDSAEVLLDVLTDQRERAVAATGVAGEVREFQLRVRFRFRLRGVDGRERIAPIELLLNRELSFTETQVLGKESEVALVYRALERDVAQQVLRRLVASGG